MSDNTTADANFEEIYGHEALVDPAVLRPSEAARFSVVASKVSGDDLEGIVPLLEAIEEKYVVDADLYQKVYRENGLEGIIELVVAWLGELVAAKH